MELKLYNDEAFDLINCIDYTVNVATISQSEKERLHNIRVMLQKMLNKAYVV